MIVINSAVEREEIGGAKNRRRPGNGIISKPVDGTLFKDINDIFKII